MIFYEIAQKAGIFLPAEGLSFVWIAPNFFAIPARLPSVAAALPYKREILFFIDENPFDSYTLTTPFARTMETESRPLPTSRRGGDA